MDVDFGQLWLGFIVPFIIMLVKQSGFDDRTNRLIAVACYIVWAVIVTVATTGLNIGDDPSAWIVTLLNNFAATIVVGTVTYQLILKQFGIDDKITEVTSVVKSPVLDEVIDG